jgi:hypothetical protein
MRDTDTAEFIAMLRDVFGMYPSAKQPSDGQLAMFFRAVSGYPLDVVRAAFDAHVRDPQRGRFPPLPADLIAQIDGAKADDGRPGADEAWAIAVRSHDENATVVWTEEITQAWGIAKAVMDLGDEVGARVAFRDAYNRITVEARRAGVPLRWVASLGLDPEGRAQALSHAEALGRMLPAPQTALLLEGPKRDDDGMRKMLRNAPPEVRDRLLRLRDQLAAGLPIPEEESKRVAPFLPEPRYEPTPPPRGWVDRRTIADLIEMSNGHAAELAQGRA